MRNAADYFGLMAYMWVMFGGMPESDLVPLEEEDVARRPARGRLRVVKGSGRPAQKRVSVPEAGEAAA